MSRSTRLLLNRICLSSVLIDIFLPSIVQGSPIFEIGVCKSIADNGQPLKIDCTQEPKIFCCRKSYSKNSPKFCCDKQTYLKNIQRYLDSILIAGTFTVCGTLIIFLLTAATIYCKLTTPHILSSQDTSRTTKSASKSWKRNESILSKEKIIAILKNRFFKSEDPDSRTTTYPAQATTFGHELERKSLDDTRSKEENQLLTSLVRPTRFLSALSIEKPPKNTIKRNSFSRTIVADKRLNRRPLHLIR